MSKSKKVWIPAGMACLAAILLLAYSYYVHASRHFEGAGHRPPAGERLPGRPKEEGHSPFKGWITTLGTITLYIAALSFSWYWFKKKMKSPSMLVRKAGRLLYSAHKWMGWAVVILIAIHGAYFVVTDWSNDKVFSGLGAFALLLAIAGYGYLIRTVRNKWMRQVHRWLSVAWVPVLFLHAGGSVIIAVFICLGVFGTVRVLEKYAGAGARAEPKEVE